MSGNLAHQRQTKTDTAIAVFAPTRRAVKRLENVLSFLLWDARAAVGDAQPGSAVSRYYRGCNGGVSGITAGVFQEIPHQTA